MKKAVMISIAPKWWAMIKNGTKTLEFRNYGIPKGTKVYLRVTKGNLFYYSHDKEGKNIVKNKIFTSYQKREKYYDTHINGAYGVFVKDEYYKGLVVGEFIVGEKYTLQQNVDGTVSMYFGDISNFQDNEPLNKPRAILNNQGYTNQSHAHTITDLIVYDEEWIFNELGDKDLVPNRCKNLMNAPTSPIHWNEFVSWNKCVKDYKKNGIDLYENIDYIQQKHYLTSPNQGLVYVVERNSVEKE